MEFEGAAPVERAQLLAGAAAWFVAFGARALVLVGCIFGHSVQFSSRIFARRARRAPGTEGLPTDVTSNMLTAT